MNKLEQLAREATDLNSPDAEAGLVSVMSFSIGLWEVTVYVKNWFALHHCDSPGVITEQGRDLDTVLDRMLARVQDAVAGTPAEQVA